MIQQEPNIGDTLRASPISPRKLRHSPGLPPRSRGPQLAPGGGARGRRRSKEEGWRHTNILYRPAPRDCSNSKGRDAALERLHYA